MAGLGRRRALKTKKKINGTRIKNGELVKRMQEEGQNREWRMRTGKENGGGGLERIMEKEN